jgi:hypothetical protein
LVNRSGSHAVLFASERAQVESFLLQLDGQTVSNLSTVILADGFESGDIIAWSP